MANKKKKSSRKRPVRSPADSAAGRTNVILEGVQSQLRVVADGLISLEETFSRKLTQELQPIKAELGIVKAAVEVHTGQLTALTSDVSVLKSDMSMLKTTVKAIETKLDAKANKTDHDDLESRVEALEAAR